MALGFPVSATNGQEHVVDNIAYVYDATLGVWNIKPFNVADQITYETLASRGDVGSGAGQVASGSHNHDTVYELLGHTHVGTYEPLDGNIVKAPGDVLPTLDGTNLSIKASTSTAFGGLKARLSGTTLYLRDDGVDA